MQMRTPNPNIRKSINHQILKSSNPQIFMSSTDLALRLLLAAGLGAAIGIEREIHQKPAGLRTNMLIALGSALFTAVSIQMAHAGGTSDRIAAQIVTGIGFVGGGAILRSGKNVQG